MGEFLKSYSQERINLNTLAAMLCLNEVHFGAPLPAGNDFDADERPIISDSDSKPAGMCAIARAKSSHKVFHKICVEGHRFMGQEALQSELVNELASSGDEVMSKARKLADRVGPIAKAGVSDQ